MNNAQELSKPAPPQKRDHRWRNLLIAVWRLQFFVLAVFALWPVSYGVTRLAMALLLAGIWVGALWLFWKARACRVLCSLAALCAVVVVLFPARSGSPVHLRSQFVDELKAFEGTKYVWGGENSMGIDCSGLIRRSMTVANIKQGITSLNPSLVRKGLIMWWFDASAKAMLEGYRQETVKLFEAEAISGLDHERIQAGDFAVTSDGIHTLAYLGDRKWIEADPGFQRVVTLTSGDENGWLRKPVVLLRWRQFE